MTSPWRERREVWRGETISANFLARESAKLSPILARQWWRHFRLWWPLREGRAEKCEGGNDKCEFLARESANLSPILARKWWRHFRLTTSVSLLPSLSLSLSLSHRLYLTHNIGSASALPIIPRVNNKERNKRTTKKLMENARKMKCWLFGLASGVVKVFLVSS